MTIYNPIKPKLTANEFIQEYIDPLHALLPYAKVHEFTEHAHKVENAFERDTISKTYDYLENQILTSGKERLDAYIKSHLASKSISAEEKRKLEYKIRETHAIKNLGRFITAFQLMEITISRLEPQKKISTLDKFKSLFKS